MPKHLIQFLILAVALCAVLSPAQAKTKKILVLHSYHQGLEWTDDITAGIQSVLDPMNSEIYYEYLDTKRNTGERYARNLIELFQSKQKNIPFDLVIAADNNALEFVRKYGSSLYPNAPVVFCGINHFNESLIAGIDQVTGIVEHVDIKATIELMLGVHPKVQKILVIIDKTTTGRAIAQDVQDAAIHFKNRVEFEYYSDFMRDDIDTYLNGLNEEYLIYLLTFNRDKNNAFVSYSEAIDLISRAAQAPVYGSWDFYMGKGIVGGVITSGFAQGEQAAKLAFKILSGESANNIPIIKALTNKTVFDFKVMTEFGIKKSQLPKNSTIINTPPSLFVKLGHIPLWIAFSVAGIVLLLLKLSAQRRKQAAVIQKNMTLDRRVKQKTSELNETGEKLNTLLNTLPCPVFYKDAACVYQMCNNAFADTILGLAKEKIIGRSLYDLSDRVPASLANIYNSQDLKLMEASGTQFYESKVKCADGNTKDFIFHKATLSDSSGKISGIVGAMLDITQRKKIENDLKESEERFRCLQEASFEAIAIHKGGIVIDANQRLSEMTGYSHDELVGMNGLQLFAPDFRDQVQNLIRQDSDSAYQAEAANKDGTLFHVEVCARMVSYQGEMARVVVTRDITEQLKAQEDREKLIGELERANTQLQTLATTDALTGIFNRGYISQRVTEELKKSQRYGCALTIVMLDIDHFKMINDTWGHQVGDFVLQQVSQVLENCIRESDRVGRYGGEEFLLILPHTELDNGYRLANRIRETIGALDWQYPEMKVTISGGIAQYSGESEMALLHTADTRLYCAKSQGRNRINRD